MLRIVPTLNHLLLRIVNKRDICWIGLANRSVFRLSIAKIGKNSLKDEEKKQGNLTK